MTGMSLIRAMQEQLPRSKNLPCARDIRASLHSRRWWGELRLEIPNKSDSDNQRVNEPLDWLISLSFGEISEAFRSKQDDISRDRRRRTK